MYYDPTGNFAISIGIALFATFVISAGASAISQGLQYGWNNISLLQVGVDGLFGMASVALATTGVGMLASIGLGAAMGFGQYAISSGLHGEDLTLKGALIAIGIGAICGAISGAGAKNNKLILKNLDKANVGGSGVKALTTAANRYAAGEISKKGLQGTINLFGQSTFNAIQGAIPGITSRAFTTSAIRIMFSAGLAPFASYAFNNGYDYLKGYNW